MRKTILTLFFFFLLVVPVCFAAPPQTIVQAEVPGLEIIYPKQIYFLYGEDIDLHFHVYNSTNQLQTNSSTTCLIHIYNRTGNHLIEENLAFDGNGIDFFIEVSNDVLDAGDFSYLVQCGNDIEYGFLSTSFIVARSNPSVSQLPLITIILLPLLFGFLLLIGVNGLDKEKDFGEKKDHVVIKIFMLILSFLSIILSYHLATIVMIEYYPTFTSIQDALGFQTFWITISVVMILTYFIIYSIYKMFKTAAQDKEDELQY